MPEANAEGFIITPFSDDLEWITDLIRGVGSERQVFFKRADDIFKPGVIIEQILDAIDRTDVIVAVTSGRNANVFFELGYAWRKHHPILIAETAEDMPFDVSAWRHLLYGQGFACESPEELRRQLGQAIDSVLEHGRPLPRGRVLGQPPTRRSSARVVARYESTSSRGGGRLILRNAGTLDVESVDINVPPDARLSVVETDELPVDLLRPGESVQIQARSSVAMNDTRRSNFDVVVRGVVNGEVHEWPSKVSV